MREGIFHLSVKVIQRSKGRSATGAIAYRAGIDITDERTGLRFDYTRKTGVSYSEIITPAIAPARYKERSTLWNEAECKETRVNSTVAREFEVALPADLPRAAREELARAFTQWLVDRFGFVADLNMHDPHPRNDAEDGESLRNYHAHILTTTRRVDVDGFTEKCRELDTPKSSAAVEEARAKYAELVNAAYAKHEVEMFVDHRSFARRGIDQEPTIHVGVNQNGDRAAINDAIKARNTINDALAVVQQDQARMQEMLDRLQSVPLHSTYPLFAELEPPQEPAYIDPEEEPQQALPEPPHQVQAPQQLELDFSAPVVDVRAELVAERETLLALKRDASKYGTAVAEYADKASDLDSFKRVLSDITPPRYARVHEMLGTGAWQDYVQKKEAATRRVSKAQKEVQTLRDQVREFKPKSDEWDRKGNARMLFIEYELAKHVLRAGDSSQNPQSSPSAPSSAVFHTLFDIEPS